MAEHTETLVGKSVQFIGTAPFFGQKLAGQKRCRVDGRRREFIEAVYRREADLPAASGRSLWTGEHRRARWPT